MGSTLIFRNVQADVGDPVETWPLEALATAIARGGLFDWRRIVAVGPVDALRCALSSGTAGERGREEGGLMADPYELERFVAAQEGGVYERALAELRRGSKTGHWMWFIFPQLAGLGFSAMSQWYAIGSADEARAYLAHPVLGPRLRECAQAVADTKGRTAEQVFGPIDAMKLRSSMTLFHRADPDEPVFAAVLHRFFEGAADEATDRRL